MKILYIITQADGGGAQKYVLTLAGHFGGAVAAGTEAGQLFTDAQKQGLAVFKLKHLKRSINPWHDFLAIWEIRQLINYYRPDIVHLNSTKAGILGSFAAIGTKTRTVFTAHGFVFNEPLSKPLKALYLSLEKVASDYRDFIITVSRADRQSALNYGLISPNKIQTIHNGIPQINFLPRAEARSALSTSPFGGQEGEGLVFCTIANFYKTKGLDVLIEAVAKIEKKLLEKARFVIIGSGPEFSNLKSKISNLKLENAITLLGNVPDASRCLKAFDVFVLPSRKEGLPYTLLEAMQAGLPIIATDAGGVREALDGAGIIIEPHNPDVLARALAGILRSPGNLESLAQKARERSKNFSEEQMLGQTETIYRNLSQSQTW